MNGKSQTSNHWDPDYATGGSAHTVLRSECEVSPWPHVFEDLVPSRQCALGGCGSSLEEGSDGWSTLRFVTWPHFLCDFGFLTISQSRHHDGPFPFLNQEPNKSFLSNTAFLRHFVPVTGKAADAKAISENNQIIKGSKTPKSQFQLQV